MNTKRITTLDGLRALSIAMVLFGHGVREIPRIASLGNHLSSLGVRVFFVISGFLITSILVIELTESGTLHLKRFYIRRAWRLMPAFYAYVLFTAILTWLGFTALHLEDYCFALTYTTNFYMNGPWELSHFWTLANEEQFYLIWPVVFLMTGTRHASKALFLALMMGPITRVWLAFLGYNASYNTIFPAVCDALAMGCLLALFRKHLHEKQTYLRFLHSGLYFVLVPVAFFVELPLPHILSNAIGPTLICAAIACVLDGVITCRDTWAGKMLQLSGVALVGRMSYSIYLWQQLFLNPHAHFWWNRFPVNFILALGLAALSYWLLEQPLQRFGMRFSSKRLAETDEVMRMARQIP